MKMVFLSVLALFALSASGLAEDLVSELWTDIHDGGIENDYMWGVTIDSQANVIACGYLRGPTGHAQDNTGYVVKYGLDGEVLWSDTLEMGPVAGQKQDSNDSFLDVAVDSENNVIVVGVESGTWATQTYHQRMIVRKYTPAGVKLWERTFQDGTQSAWNGGRGVVVDEQDNIYVAGSVFTDWGTTRHQWAIWKYDKDGNLQANFPVRYNYSTSETYPDHAYGVAVDKDGNFIGVGIRGVASGNYDWHVRKYDSDRNLVWEDTYEGNGLYDYARGVDVDSKGDVIVVGYKNIGTDSGANANYDWLIIKYKADEDLGGEQRLWTQTFDSGVGNEHSYDVIADPQDNLLVGGCTTDDSGKSQWRMERRSGADGTLLAEQVWESENHGSIYGLAYRDRRIALCGYENNGTDNDMRIRFVACPPPEITLSGDNPMTLEVGTEYVEPGATATDDFEGDLTAELVVTGSVDHTSLGAYEIRYNVSASNGDPAKEKIRTVNVVDTTAPVITLLGDDPMTIEVGTAFVDPECTADDNYDGDLTGSVVFTGSVDSNTLGEYILRYNVSDSSGNPAPEKTRTVNVVDTTPPTITLLGDNPMNIEMGTPFSDPGTTAEDNYDGDLSASVSVTGSVDENVPGSYELRYNVSDSSGNSAPEQVRTVNVIDTTPFGFTEVGEIAEGIFQLTWESRPGDSFVIWSTTDLLGEWEIAIPIYGSQGETTTWIDPSAGGAMKFYKIERK